MFLILKKNFYKSSSGQDSYSVSCFHCHGQFIYDFKGLVLANTCLIQWPTEEKLQILIQSINDGSFRSKFSRRRTFRGLEDELCFCHEKVVDFERYLSCQRAIRIKELGEML